MKNQVPDYEIKGLSITVHQTQPEAIAMETTVDETDIEWIEFSIDRTNWRRVTELKVLYLPSEESETKCLVETSAFCGCTETLHVRYQDRKGRLRNIFSTDEYTTKNEADR